MALAIASGILWVVTGADAHDPAQEAQEAIANLNARADLAESRALNQGVAMDELFRLIDNLHARMDILQSNQDNQNVITDDLYDAIDRINKRLGELTGGPDVAPSDE